MATRDEIKEKVIDIVVDQLQISRDQVEEKASLVDDLGADSLDVAEVIMELEDEFDINIPDDEEAPRTIGESIDYIAKQAGDK
ncbi:MAG: acyl carrier protein [Planctomycetota bacterium]